MFHVVVSEVSCCQAIVALSGRYAVSGQRLLVHTLGELTRTLLNDGFQPPWTLPASPDTDADWLVRPATWDLDGKHNSPLNHLRFYIPHFTFMKDVERVLFVDDDIIVNRDIAEVMKHKVFPTTAIVTSCAISSYLKECDAFELRAEEFTYAQTPFFGWRAFNLNGLKKADIFCSKAQVNECIQTRGMDLIQSEAKRINGEEVDFEHLKAWNYGYTLMHNTHWLEMHLTKRYENWILSNLEHKIVPTYSLGYGLGLAFFAMAGTVQCYDPAVVRVMEGMAFLDRFDLLANNITEAMVDASTYIHFTGDRKPWAGNAFEEWRGRYEHVNVQFDFSAKASRRRKRLFMLVSGPREGTEWVMSSLDASPEVCASGEATDSARGFPSEAFIPESTILGGEWQNVCSRKAVCTWRHFVKLVDGTPEEQNAYRYGGGIGPAWRAWFNGPANRNGTLLFKTFLLAITRDPDHMDAYPELALPCRCKESAEVIGFKWFLPWSSITGEHREWTLNYYKANNRTIRPLEGAFEIHVHALAVLKELGTKFIWWQRNDVRAAYASLQNARASNVFHCRDGDNCTRVAAEIDPKESAFFVKRTQEERAWARTMFKQLDIEPLVISYEECSKNNVVCAMQLQEALGLEHPNPALLSSSHVKKYVTVDAKAAAAEAAGGAGKQAKAEQAEQKAAQPQAKEQARKAEQASAAQQAKAEAEEEEEEGEGEGEAEQAGPAGDAQQAKAQKAAA